MNAQPTHVREAIDAVAENATQQIKAQLRQNGVRTLVSTSILLVLVVPVMAVVLQVIRWGLGLDAGQWFSWPALISLSIAVPVLWLIAKALGLKANVQRLNALGAMDAKLGASERMTTADQFLRSESRDAFMQAAVEDALEWTEQGRSASFDSAPAEVRIGRALIAIPVAGLLIVAASWLSELAIPAGQLQASSGPNASSVVGGVETEQAKPRPRPNEQEEKTVDENPREQRGEKPRRAGKQKAAKANATPDGAEKSQGRLTDGEASESQQTSNPSSAQGNPSSQAQATKPESPTPRKPKKKTKQKTDKEVPKRPKDEQEEPSGATAGQGSSRGSQNNAAPSDWASRSQEATPDDEDVEDEDDVDDEEEEQRSRGGVQPNVRDRRAPVNRDLQIGFGSGRPNPDANGRGGPGAQKKSRGVASLVLGVPIPDRVNGQPNKGRIRVTQQRVTPEAEESDRVLAERRSPRTGPVGPIHHPKLSPWLQDFVRRYFLARRKSAARESANEQPPKTSAATTESSRPTS